MIRGMNDINSGQGRQGQPDCCQMIGECIRRLPFCTRFICLTVTIMTLVGMFSTIIVAYMISLPTAVIDNLEFWRMVSAPWIGVSILNALLGGLMFLCFMPDLERHIGSAKFFFRYIFLGIVYQIFFIGIGYLLSDYQKFWDAGLLFAYFTQFAAFCFRNPNATIMCCMICPMKAIFVPFIVVIIQAIFGRIPLRYLICLLLAFLDSKDLLNFLLIPDKCARALDTSIFSCFAKSEHYVKQSEALQEEAGFLSGIFNQRRQQAQQDNAQPEQPQQAQPQQSFQGRGVTLQSAINMRERAELRGEIPVGIPAEPPASYNNNAGRNQISTNDRQRIANSILFQRYGARAGLSNQQPQQQQQQNRAPEPVLSDSAVIEMERRNAPDQEDEEIREEQGPTGVQKGGYQKVPLQQIDRQFE